jgi:hypothetical protein
MTARRETKRYLVNIVNGWRPFDWPGTRELVDLSEVAKTCGYAVL